MQDKLQCYIPFCYVFAGPPYEFYFRVKFYVSDPSKLEEEYTRYGSSVYCRFLILREIMRSTYRKFLNSRFYFLDRYKLNKSMINNLTFAILYSHDLMQKGWIAELSTRVKKGINSIMCQLFFQWKVVLDIELFIWEIF